MADYNTLVGHAKLKSGGTDNEAFVYAILALAQAIKDAHFR